MFISLDPLLEKDDIYCNMIICSWVFLLWPDTLILLIICLRLVFCWCFLWVLVFFGGEDNTNLALHVTGSRWIGEEGDFSFPQHEEGTRATP